MQVHHRWRGATKVLEDGAVYTLNLSTSTTFQEVVIPTASYRMGVPRMGYSTAVVGKVLCFFLVENIGSSILFVRFSFQISVYCH